MKTFLYDIHEKLGAKMSEYASFLMPIEYSGIQNEHQAVRTACGIFDVSHMGEILIEGPEALKFVNYLIPNVVKAEDSGKVVYGMFLNEQGCLLDDLFVYKLSNESILLVVNAANITRDIEWVRNWRKNFNVKVKNKSGDYCEVALQGPQAKEVFEKYFKVTVADFKFMTFRMVPYQAEQLIVSRSGYTGEDGFEIYGSKESIHQIFSDLITQYKVTPCGLGARDTLRFEACLPLYGNETNLDVNPFEANLGFGVKLAAKPDDFLGKQALLQIQQAGLKRKIVGLELIDRNIARHGYKVFKDGHEIGHITTGYMSISLGKPLALAMLDISATALNTEVEIEIRNKMVRAKVVPTPFYQKHYAR